MRALTLICASLFSLAAAGCERHIAVHAETPSANAPVKGISVTGNAEIETAPDIARLLLGVEARAPTAEVATEQVRQQMERVVLALKQQGVQPRDLQTRELSVMFEMPHPPPFEPPPPPPAPMPRPDPRGEKPPAPPSAAAPRPGEYRVTNLLEVTVRDLSRLGQLISTATGAGANRMHGITFDLEQPEKLEAEARKQAIERARTRAAELAQLTGVELGPVVSVTEHGGGARPMPAGFAMARTDAVQDMPVERGELTIRHEVQVVFAIRKRD